MEAALAVAVSEVAEALEAEDKSEGYFNSKNQDGGKTLFLIFFWCIRLILPQRTQRAFARFAKFFNLAKTQSRKVLFLKLCDFLFSHRFYRLTQIKNSFNSYNLWQKNKDKALRSLRFYKVL